MVMSNPWTLLLLAISAEVIGTSCLRLSEGMTRPLCLVLSASAKRDHSDQAEGDGA